MAQVQPFLSRIDLLLVMTVNPGFGGQPFIPETLTKIQQAAAWRRDSGANFHIEVDGGITFITAKDCARAGATPSSAAPACSASTTCGPP